MRDKARERGLQRLRQRDNDRLRNKEWTRERETGKGIRWLEGDKLRRSGKNREMQQEQERTKERQRARKVKGKTQRDRNRGREGQIRKINGEQQGVRGYRSDREK